MARNAYLDEYYLLGKAIEELEEEIYRLEASLVASPGFDTSGVPKNPSPQNRTEAKYIAICAKREKLQTEKKNYEQHKANVELYIENIPDLFTRRIFEKRIFRRMKFRQIANELGGGNTEEGVRQAFNRYLKGNPITCHECHGSNEKM